MRNDIKSAYLSRLALLLEREAKLQGYDIETLITQILAKLEKEPPK